MEDPLQDQDGIHCHLLPGVNPPIVYASDSLIVQWWRNQITNSYHWAPLQHSITVLTPSRAQCCCCSRIRGNNRARFRRCVLRRPQAASEGPTWAPVDRHYYILLDSSSRVTWLLLEHGQVSSCRCHERTPGARRLLPAWNSEWLFVVLLPLSTVWL